MWRTILASPVLSDAATITTGPYAAAMPPRHLQSQQPRDRLRLTDRTEAVITIDLADAMARTRIESWDLVAPLYMLAYDADDQIVSLDTSTYELAAASSVAGLSSPTFANTYNVWPSANLYHREVVRLSPAGDPIAGPGIHSVYFNEYDSLTETAIRLTYSLPAEVAYLDIGRLYVAKSVRASAGIAFRPRHGPIEEERRHRTLGGSTIPRQMPQSDVVELVIQEMAPGALAAYYSGVYRLRKERGSSRDVLVVLDTGTFDSSSTNEQLGDMIVMGLMTGLGADDLPDTGHGSFPVRIEELT